MKKGESIEASRNLGLQAPRAPAQSRVSSLNASSSQRFIVFVPSTERERERDSGERAATIALADKMSFGCAILDIAAPHAMSVQ